MKTASLTAAFIGGLLSMTTFAVGTLKFGNTDLSLALAGWIVAETCAIGTVIVTNQAPTVFRRGLTAQLLRAVTGVVATAACGFATYLALMEPFGRIAAGVGVGVACLARCCFVRLVEDFSDRSDDRQEQRIDQWLKDHPLVAMFALALATFSLVPAAAGVSMQTQDAPTECEAPEPVPVGERRAEDDTQQIPPPTSSTSIEGDNGKHEAPPPAVPVPQSNEVQYTG